MIEAITTISVFTAWIAGFIWLYRAEGRLINEHYSEVFMKDYRNN